MVLLECTDFQVCSSFCQSSFSFVIHTSIAVENVAAMDRLEAGSWIAPTAFHFFLGSAGMSSSCVSAGRTGTCVFNALTHLLVQRSGTACSEGKAAYELQLDVQSTREREVGIWPEASKKH